MIASDECGDARGKFPERNEAVRLADEAVRLADESRRLAAEARRLACEALRLECEARVGFKAGCAIGAGTLAFASGGLIAFGECTDDPRGTVFVDADGTIILDSDDAACAAAGRAERDASHGNGDSRRRRRQRRRRRRGKPAAAASPDGESPPAGRDSREGRSGDAQH
jgi:hypothetical protein